MPTHHGIAQNTIYPQPGFNPQRDEKGGWTAAQVFIVLRQAWSNTAVRAKFARGTSILVIDPTLEPFWSFLKVTGINITHEEAEHVTINANFSGSPDTQYSTTEDSLSEGAIPTYRLEGRISEMPLSEHPKWQALDEDERIALGRFISGNLIYNSAGEDGPGLYELSGLFFAEDQVDSADAIAFRDIIREGQTTYRFPTVTWTETTQGAGTLTAAQLNKLGRISTPRGNPPALTGSRNWMLTGASQEQAGDLRQTTLEWELSEREGWNAFLYDT
jgi:hypothetical protein